MIEVVNQQVTAAPDGTELGRRAWLVILYNGKDISEDISKYWLSFSYTDNLSGTADDVDLTLEDRQEIWRSDWFPDLTARLKIDIHMFHWKSLEEGEAKYEVGEFEIDEIECTGVPSTTQIKAVSVGFEGPLRNDKKNRTWEDVTVQAIAGDIAGECGLSLEYQAEENPTIDHIEQSDKGDLEFLQKLTGDHGLSLKVEPTKLIIFDEAQLESQAAQITIKTPEEYPILSYSLKAKTRDIYTKAHVRYHKDKDKEVIEGEFEDSSVKTGKTLEVDAQVEDQGEAERLAKKKLREANKDAVTATFNVMGDFSFAAGVIVQIEGYGAFDGKYIITRSTHHLGATYTTSMEMRKCLNGY